MRRLFMLIVLGVLVMDATGLDALVSSETCTAAQDAQPDGTCPSLCVRCACCAQPFVQNIAVSVASVTVRQPVADTTPSRLARTDPSKIFHVPKIASSTI